MAKVNSLGVKERVPHDGKARAPHNGKARAPHTILAPDISSLEADEDDCRRAALDRDQGPYDPIVYYDLMWRLEASREKLPPLYREAVYKPFINKLNEMGWLGFSMTLMMDLNRTGVAGMMMDIAQAILQNGEGYEEAAMDAFEEVISDLYDGFLSAEDRHGIKPPEKTVVPPLVKWGRPQYGPYTWPGDATRSGFDVEAAIVNMPPANAHLGLMAWSALPHETCGHDVLHANPGLLDQYADMVRTELQQHNIKASLSEYWALRIDETASDVMGILNMGPAVGIGLIGFFRGMHWASQRGEPKLRNEGPDKDPHPADILRGYLAAETVSLLSFSEAKEWAKIIREETDKDLGRIILAGEEVSAREARQSAEIVAKVLATGKSRILGNHALIEIQDWRDRDEETVKQLREVLTRNAPLDEEVAMGFYAAHVVAAAVMESLTKNANIPRLFTRMLTILKMMHDKNPSWGPLYIVHPGSIRRDLAYLPAATN